MKLLLSAGSAALAAVLVTATPASAALYINIGDISAYVNDWAVGSEYTNFAFSSSTLAYVGSWQVDNGPSWTTSPTIYSGLTAAALLFGGSASDYFISTVDNNSSNINHLTWVSTYGGACQDTFPCGTKVAEGAFSAGAVPEPASWALLIAGFGLTGAAMRRRAKTTVAG